MITASDVRLKIGDKEFACSNVDIGIDYSSERDRWNKSFWKDGRCLASISGTSIDVTGTIEWYIISTRNGRRLKSRVCKKKLKRFFGRFVFEAEARGGWRRGRIKNES